jgi:lactoylglutathione lyase
MNEMKPDPAARLPKASELRINHMSLLVVDLERSLEFYQTALLLPEIECLARHPRIRWVGLGDNQSIHLIEGDFAGIAVKMATHLCISTHHYEAMLAHFRTTGVVFGNLAGEPGKEHTRPDGVKSVYLQDPDGYWIEMSQEF